MSYAKATMTSPGEGALATAQGRALDDLKKFTTLGDFKFKYAALSTTGITVTIDGGVDKTTGADIWALQNLTDDEKKKDITFE
jgi:hypothetical protein